MNKKVFVQMSADRSCLLTADRIEYADDSTFVRVYNGNELVGMFDSLQMMFIYMTECK